MQATQVCYVPYPSIKRDKDDWLAVLKVKPRDVIELPDEKVITTLESNLPFQVEEVEIHEIDMNITVDEITLLHDPNGETIEANEPTDGVLPEHHVLEEESIEDEYKTEDETEEGEEEEFEDKIDIESGSDVCSIFFSFPCLIFLIDFFNRCRHYSCFFY